MKTYENRLYHQKYKMIAGLDEAGRGCWAGPLVIALCVFDSSYVNQEINDSKKLKETQRAKVFNQIIKDAQLVDWIIYDASFVDQYNPKKASIMGMQYLIEKHQRSIDYCLIDYEKVEVSIPTQSITKGDAKSQTIAAASIVAKYIRDQIMNDLDKQYPFYSFKIHKGYGTKKHYEALLKYHPIKKVHRFSYKPIQKILNLINTKGGS